MSVVQYGRSERGQSVVEFSLALPLFAVAFFAIVEFSHLFYVRLTLQHALKEAGRYMATGQGQDPSVPQARENAIKNVFCSKLIGTGLTCPALGDPQFTMNPSNGGAPGDIVTVTASFTKPLFTGIFRLFDPLFPTAFTLTVSTTWKNEPYVTA